MIGVGRIGGTLARHFVEAGHDVAISNSRGPDTLRELASELGEHAHPATSEEAAAFGEVVVVSIPFGRYRDVPAEDLAGKVVIDTNNYYPGRDGRFASLDSGEDSSSEMLQAHLSRSRVVKAFNAIFWERLAKLGRPAGSADRLAIPISGDDEQAKATVAGLIDQIGFDVVDAGSLGDGGRRHQPGTAVYNQPLTAAEMSSVLEEP